MCGGVPFYCERLVWVAVERVVRAASPAVARDGALQGPGRPAPARVIVPGGAGGAGGASLTQWQKERQRKERVAAEKEARRTAKLAHKNSCRKGPVHQVCRARADLGVQNNRADSDV